MGSTAAVVLPYVGGAAADLEDSVAYLYGTRLFHSDKPVVWKIHGFCVAGGTDMALCSDLIVIGDEARIGVPTRPYVGGCRPRPCGRSGSATSAPTGSSSPAT